MKNQSRSPDLGGVLQCWLHRTSAACNLADGSAFTLLEILVVVAIVVTMASVAGVGVFRYLEDSKKSRAQLDIKALEKAVKAYQIKNDNNPPDSLRDALRFIDNATEQNLIDPWGKQYSYQPHVQNGDQETVLISTTVPKEQTRFLTISM